MKIVVGLLTGSLGILAEAAHSGLDLVAAVLYHALNGIRVILIDFWAQGVRHQRLMLWTIAVVWLLVMVPAAVVVGIHVMGHVR